jgi:asparagine synthase (glutamine-hydrolysing)
LSGGLDSSIVVGLLRHAPTQPECLCVNYRNPYDPVSDERHYARMVANRAGYRLIEMEQSAEFSFAPILSMPRTASPCLNVFGLGEICTLAEFARAHRMKAWFVGEGGDEVFLKSAGEYHCADFIHRYGLRPKVVAIALEAARMTSRALLPTLREGILDGLTRNGLERTLKHQDLFPLLCSDVLDDVRRQRLFVPSWFDGSEPLAPGKCFQIMSLSLTDTMHNPYAPDDDPELVYPLKSQPVQELCLRVPTHVLAHGGRSRGLARVAFRDDLPPEIARRRTKGTVFDYVKALWIANRSMVRELLLDGLLVREGIVDKNKLEGSIAGTFDAGFANVARLASLACAEAWARNWEQAKVRIAA